MQWQEHTVAIRSLRTESLLNYLRVRSRIYSPGFDPNLRHQYWINGDKMYENVSISATYEGSQEGQILNDLTVYVVASDGWQCQHFSLPVQDKGLFPIYRN